MNTEDASRRIANKKAREEKKRMEWEKRLEYVERQKMVRRRGGRIMAKGFGILAIALGTTVYTYYTNPSLIQGEMEILRNIFKEGPTSGPKS